AVHAVVRRRDDARRGVLDEPVALVVEAGEPELDAIAEQRATDRRLRPPAVELAVFGLDEAGVFARRLARDDVHEAGRRVAPEQRSLRAAQHLDALEVVQR